MVIPNDKSRLRKTIHANHIVKDTNRNPRKTVSSRTGARTPVIPSKQIVLQKKKDYKTSISLVTLYTTTYENLKRNPGKSIPDT
jgi:hypothetical protein